MEAIKNFFKKLFNLFCLDNFEEEFEVDPDEKNCTYTLSSIFPSPEIEEEVLAVLEKINKENKEVS